MKNQIAELTPIYSNRKSFYRKAIVETFKNGTKVLYSYDTPIIEISPDGKVKGLCFEGDISKTTSSHIKEFCLQNGINRKEIVFR